MRVDAQVSRRPLNNIILVGETTFEARFTLLSRSNSDFSINNGDLGILLVAVCLVEQR